MGRSVRTFRLVRTALVIISGGVFASLSLVNSNLFGTKLFSMGLSKQQLTYLQRMQFSLVVCLENIPQIIIQISYIYSQGNWSPTVVSALISSLLSTLITLTAFFISSGNLHGSLSLSLVSLLWTSLQHSF